MSDLVVTCPKTEWAEWLAEGDCAGQPNSGQLYGFYIGRRIPPIVPGERLYIVAHGRLRGYAPVVNVRPGCIFRAGNAVAVTIPGEIKGFRGWRNRWWNYSEEQPFPDWKSEGVA